MYYSNLCDALPSEDICVLAPHRDGEKEYDKTKKYRIFRANLLYTLIWPKWLKVYKMAKISLKRCDAKMILVGQVLPMGYIAYMLKKWRNLPYAVFIHGMDITMQNINSRKKKWRKKILEHADYVLANSEYSKQEVRKLGIQESKIHIINPCPAAKAEIIPEKLEDIKTHHGFAGKKVLLYVGRLTKRKGLDIVIKSLPEVIKQIPNLVYAIIGDGPERKRLEKLVDELKLRDHVIFTGAIDIKVVSYYFQLCDAFIMTTRPSETGDVESWGMVYLEAGVFGKPVIASNVGGVSETVINHETGILLEEASVESVQKAIIELFSDPERMSKFGVQGQKRVNELFTWEKQARKLQDILSKS